MSLFKYTLSLYANVVGMYKYIATEEDVSMPKQSAYRREHRHNVKADRYKKISSKYCNAAENINLGSEGDCFVQHHLDNI